MEYLGEHLGYGQFGHFLTLLNLVMVVRIWFYLNYTNPENQKRYICRHYEKDSPNYFIAHIGSRYFFVP